MAYNPQTTLGLVKSRLNRMLGDASLDEMLNARIAAVDEELAKTGIFLEAESMSDTMFLVDMVVWQYQNRDAPGDMPSWLALRRRERWLQEERNRVT